jgi:hypothetical protein
VRISSTKVIPTYLSLCGGTDLHKNIHSNGYFMTSWNFYLQASKLFFYCISCNYVAYPNFLCSLHFLWQLNVLYSNDRPGPTLHYKNSILYCSCSLTIWVLMESSGATFYKRFHLNISLYNHRLRCNFIFICTLDLIFTVLHVSAWRHHQVLCLLAKIAALYYLSLLYALSVVLMLK